MPTRNVSAPRRRKPRAAALTSRLMRAVRREGTAAELALQVALRKRRIFCRTHDRALPGTPDLVLRRRRIAIFVDGDYWHGRVYVERGLDALKRTFRSPTRAFWTTKILRNVNRDTRQNMDLQVQGWEVIRLWERDILSDAAGAAIKVERLLESKKK